MNSLAFFAALFLAGATPDRLPPIDQCSSDPAFQRFKSELSDIVARRDQAKLLALVADDVLVDLGGGVGQTAFMAAWNLDGPRTSDIWAELATLLRLGCTHDDGGFLMPSLFEQAGSAIDTLDTYIATIPGSPLRVEPRADSPAIATLDWDVLKMETVSDDQQWYLLSLPDGRRGYVRPGEVRIPLEHRLFVGKVGGALKITALVAGD